MSFKIYEYKPKLQAGLAGELPNGDVESNRAKEGIDRILKVVPGEALLFYTIASEAILTTPNIQIASTFVGALALLICLLFRTVGLPKESKPKFGIVLLSLSVMVVWILNEGGYLYFAVSEDWRPILWVLLFFLSLVAPLFVKGEPRNSK